MQAPRSPSDRAWDVGIVLVANAIAVVLLWLHHGGLHQWSTPGGPLTAVGQLTGLLGTYAILVELLLMSRIGWVERVIGFDRLAVWHRWTGFATVVLLVVHAVTITLGYAAGAHRTVLGETGDFVRHYPDVLMSIVGLVLFIAVGVASVRAVRSRVSREAWYAVHLYAYLAVALSFAHQLAVGTDFADDTLARVWWIALYVLVGGAILSWRVARPILFNARHRLRVHDVRVEAADVVSLYLSGRELDRVQAAAGQWFLWRFLTGTRWAKAHPFSLSAAPDGQLLRITVKALGDDTAWMQNLRPGIRVFAEGPYGTFTAERRTQRRVALIAGGIGITPIRALLEQLPAPPGDVTLLYRSAAECDITFRDELDALARQGRVEVRHLVGPEIGDDETDRLGVPALRRHLPDITDCDVFVCGPPVMVDVVRRRLAAIGVPRAQVHFERFGY